MIDVAELTPAVEAEIRLSERCMGLTRILFVVRDSASVDEWRCRIAAILSNSVHQDEILIAIWSPDKQEYQREFENRVAEFGKQLPAQPAGFQPDARHLAEQLPGEVFRESSASLRSEIVLGLAVGWVVMFALGWFKETKSPVLLVVLPLFLVWYAVLAFHYVSFRRNAGSKTRRRIAFWTVGINFWSVPLVLTLAIMMLPIARDIREAAVRSTAENQLKWIVLAMHNYKNYHEAKPVLFDANAPRRYDQKQIYPVSWRVRILPFLEQANLFGKYRFEEPWDGPNNTKLLSMIPKVYQHPNASPEQIAAGYTHYRVFGSPKGTVPAAAFTDGDEGTQFSGFTDGLSNTFLVVEAAEAVPWTKPEVLPYSPDQPLPKLGGLFKGGFNVGMADESIRFIPNSMSEDQLRARITRNGGETVKEN